MARWPTYSLELDAVCRQVVDLAATLPGVAAAIVSPAADAAWRPVASPSLGADDVRELLRRAGEAHEGTSFDVRVDARAGAGRLSGGLRTALRGPAGVVGSLDVFGGVGVTWESIGEELGPLAASAGHAIGNALRYAEALELAHRDAVTGLHNRRFFDATIGREVARAERYGRKLALVLVDLDDFKRLNDRLGHVAGDAVLAAVAARLASSVRKADLACRFGGEEFAIVLPEAGEADAALVCERVQHAVASARADAGELSLSAGISALRPGDTAETLIARADEALLAAKREGKGRAVVR
jgi:diguanylate cyclase (GGDEF)-like protein